MRIAQSIQPAVFLSYSRRQETFAARLKEALTNACRCVWYDRDQLVLGDDWRDEIKRGIAASDELVLLLSDDALASEVVNEEVSTALAQQKAIRPLVIKPLTAHLPPAISRFQYLDVSAVAERDAIAQILAFIGAIPAETNTGSLKLVASRRLHPPFTEAATTTRGQTHTQMLAAELSTLCGNHSPASAIRLNAGLAHCLAGDWLTGLCHLRTHAHAANTFAGWYFLGLHAPRRRLISTMPVGDVNEAIDATRRALALSAHPLAVLLAGLLEVGGENRGHAWLDRRIQEFSRTLGVREAGAEFMRAYWCLQPSFRLLGRYETELRNLMKGYAQ